MDVLILGYSSIVQRRVLPALLSLPGVLNIHVATRSGKPGNMIPRDRQGLLLEDYETALTRCPPGLCYVSLPNSLHAPWAGRALEQGFHVVVDKPATTSLADAQALTNLARKRGLCIAEANVWTCHPLAGAVRGIVNKGQAPPRSAIAVFTSPPLNPDNFRYQPQFGAGALLDRGPYAASCGRFLFGQAPERISCEVVSTTPDGRVDICFSVSLTYPRGGSLIGFFSLGAFYRNSLSVIGDEYSCDADRIFTPPADFQGTVTVRGRTGQHHVDTAPGDTFATFLADVLAGMAGNDTDRFADILLQDALVLERMRAAAGRLLPDQS